MQKYTQTHRSTLSPPSLSCYVSVPVRSHPVINISAVSIIDRWISPLRCTKNHSDISLLELKHQYFTNWLFGERLKGWRRCFAFCSHGAVEMKNILRCLYPCPRNFFSFTLLFLSSNQFDAFNALSLSLSIYPSLSLLCFTLFPSFFLPLRSPWASFLFLFDFLTSI